MIVPARIDGRFSPSTSPKFLPLGLILEVLIYNRRRAVDERFATSSTGLCLIEGCDTVLSLQYAVHLGECRGNSKKLASQGIERRHYHGELS